MEKELLNYGLNQNRRNFLGKVGLGLGGAALGSLLAPDLFSGDGSEALAGFKSFAPKAKRVIYLFQNGAPLTTGDI